MAIQMTVTHRVHPRGFPNDYTEETVDVDLISYDEMEFPAEDIEHMMAAQVLGIDEFDGELDFYNKYSGYEGFLRFLSKHSMDFYEALEEQGYENFNYGKFSQKRLIKEITAPLEREELAHHQIGALEAIAGATDLSEKDEGLFSQEEAKRILLGFLSRGGMRASAIITILQPFYGATEESPEDGIFDDEYIKALVSALENYSSHGSPTVIEELRSLLTKEDIDYTSEKVFIYGSDDEVWENTDIYRNKLSVFGKLLFEWETRIVSRLQNPFTFYPDVSDYGEDHGMKEYKIPETAEDILSQFDIDQKEIDDPAPPPHPVSNDDGAFAVFYEQDGRQEVIVPYREKSEATDAIELSSYIFSRDGENDWTMTLTQRDGDDWVQIDRTWRYDREDWKWKQDEED